MKTKLQAVLVRKNAVLVLAGVALFSATPSVNAAIEVVQSVPLETTLQVPGVRETQEVWLEMINAAKSEIVFEQFYLSEQAGESLTPVLNAIKAAAARGVQIRFLGDATFFKGEPTEFNSLKGVKNITVKTISFSPGIQHAKFFVVDGKQTFIGSQNFDWKAISHIHEVGIKTDDPQVAAGSLAVFNQDWGKGTATPFVSAPSTDVTSPITLDMTPPSAGPGGINDALTDIIALMDSAQSNIRVQVYQYGTKDGTKSWTALDAAMRKAAARGVHVQLMVDAVALRSAKADLQALSKLPNFEVKTVVIPQWSGGPLSYARLIHSKYMVIDSNAAWVGTANWSKGYFTSVRNLGLVVRDTSTADTLIKIYDQLWASRYSSTL